jgi:hypothetical protein
VEPIDDDAGVPPAILRRLRGICGDLPEAVEEPAWVGRRWRVRRRTFAHVFLLGPDAPPALARAGPALGADDHPVTVVAFRSEGPEHDALRAAGPPFFAAGWGRDAISMVLTDGTDWEEVTELLTESYRAVAPRKLQALLDQPGPEDPAAGG